MLIKATGPKSKFKYIQTNKFRQITKQVESNTMQGKREL